MQSEIHKIVLIQQLKLSKKFNKFEIFKYLLQKKTFKFRKINDIIKLILVYVWKSEEFNLMK